jgi:outer membrane protein OmpA-like peptidoglycan-associated protein
MLRQSFRRQATLEAPDMAGAGKGNSVMLHKLSAIVGAGAISALITVTPAYAQDPGGDLMALDGSALRAAVQSRYDEALALTQDQAIVAADTTRFVWASQAKAQCGIALGFLKSGTKDPVSLGKCNDAAMRMRMAPPPPMVLPSPAPASLPDGCGQSVAGIVFFEFDSAIVPESSAQTLESVVNYTKICSWQKLVVTGHTDRSGSDEYNSVLSERRARAVVAELEARGMPAGVLQVSGKGESEPKVPTADGERNPTNRRVELTVQ